MLSPDLTDGVILERFTDIVSADELPTTFGGGAAEHFAFPDSDKDRRCRERELSMQPHRLAPPSEFDCDLQRRVRAFLAGRHYQALRRLRVDVEADAVVLSGTVPTFHQRQVAVECAAHVAGVLRVVDRLNVSDLPEEHHHESEHNPEGNVESLECFLKKG